MTAAGWLKADAAFSNTAAALELSLIAYAQDRTKEDVDRLVRHWFGEGRVGATFVVRAAFFGAVAVVAAPTVIPKEEIEEAEEEGPEAEAEEPEADTESESD